jgi:hypothetical protein
MVSFSERSESIQEESAMIEITLTEFVDFVSKAGTPKLTGVRRVKQRLAEEYDPRTDFYKIIRDGIVSMHKLNKPKNALDDLLNGLTDKKKITAYPELVGGYKTFLGRKAVTWFPPPKDWWKHGDLSVSVNPEVGLIINGKRQIIKLYFKSEALTKMKMDIVTHLMTEELAVPGSSPIDFAILDIRNAKLIPAGNTDSGLSALLQGEAASFAQIYNSQ